MSPPFSCYLQGSWQLYYIHKFINLLFGLLLGLLPGSSILSSILLPIDSLSFFSPNHLSLAFASRTSNIPLIYSALFHPSTSLPKRTSTFSSMRHPARLPVSYTTTLALLSCKCLLSFFVYPPCFSRCSSWLLHSSSPICHILCAPNCWPLILEILHLLNLSSL